jgi:hypothetical protein
MSTLDQMSPRTPLSEFWEFAGDFKSVSAWVAKAAVAAPLTDILLNIGPPWPSRIGVAILVCIVEVLVLMYSFEFWRNASPAVKDVRRVMRLGLCAVFVSFIAYVCIFAGYVVDADDAWHREVIGYEYHKQIAELVESDPSKYTPQELMSRFEFKAMSIWTPFSVTSMRVCVLITWMLLWVCLSVVVAAFVALQWHHGRLIKVGKSRSAAKNPSLA